MDVFENVRHTAVRVAAASHHQDANLTLSGFPPGSQVSFNFADEYVPA